MTISIIYGKAMTALLRKIRIVKHAFLILCFVIINASAFAQISVVNRYIPDAQEIGAHRLRYLIWSIYDARLFAENGRFDMMRPFVLELTYLHGIRGGRIIGTTINEIRKQGDVSEDTLSNWKKTLETIIPDTQKGDVFTGVRDQNMHTVFYLNGNEIGVVKDKMFTKRFFDIWFSPKNKRKTLRDDLLGLRP